MKRWRWDGSGKSTERGKRKDAAGTAAVAALEGDTSGYVVPEEPLLEYEQQRLTRIAQNNAVMVSLGIVAHGGAPASKLLPTTTHGSGESTKRDKGEAAAGPAENARDTCGAGGSVNEVEEPIHEPIHGVYIPTHPDDDFGRGTCGEGESSGRCRGRGRDKCRHGQQRDECRECRGELEAAGGEERGQEAPKSQGREKKKNPK